MTADLDLQILQKHKVTRIIGIDEAGRGAWAGPVAVGYFVFEPDHHVVTEVADSKKLSLNTREVLHDLLLDDFEGGVLFGDLLSINQVGIGQTITNLISQIVESFTAPDTYFVIDGQFAKNFGPTSTKQIKADDLYYSVAAASILAKVRRDRIMRQHHSDFPDYGFNKHVGYGTKHHRSKIADLGICSLHRTSFAPIARYL